METQNVTLTIPKKVLQKARILAIKRNTSLSGLLTQTIEELVVHDDAYEHARRRNFEMMSRGFDLGTNGQINWKREELPKR